jgi:hypothetical protein
MSEHRWQRGKSARQTYAEYRDARGKEVANRAALWIEEPQRLAWCAAWGRRVGDVWLFRAIEMHCESGGFFLSDKCVACPGIAEVAVAALPQLLSAIASWKGEEIERLIQSINERAAPKQ